MVSDPLLQFRGWIDDLLKTSWEACQGTDVLVESPSAMGGYHIAEALRIPYFRAFTMTWSRTRQGFLTSSKWFYLSFCRAYPHAFAVPEHKVGIKYLVNFSRLTSIHRWVVIIIIWFVRSLA